MLLAYVALGANLGRREHTILRALRLLETRGAGSVVSASSLYESDAVGMVQAQTLFCVVAAPCVPLPLFRTPQLLASAVRG